MLETKLEIGFKLISQVVPYPMFLISLDGTILNTNSLPLRRYGFTKKDVLGKNISELEFLSPDGKRVLRQNLARRLQDKKISSCEISLYTRAGEERFFEVNSSSIRYGGQALDIVLFQDITILKQARQTLMKSGRDWLEIFNSLDDLVLVIDTEYNIIQVNKSVNEMVRKPEREIVGQKCYQLLHNSNKPVANCPLAKCLETTNVETLDYHEPVFDKHFLVKATPILDKDNKIMAVIDHVRDITEYKRVEEQLKGDYEAMVLSLAIALEARDPYTRGHSDRVKLYCRAIARQ